jgi:hypothetical protein
MHVCSVWAWEFLFSVIPVYIYCSTITVSIVIPSRNSTWVRLVHFPFVKPTIGMKERNRMVSLFTDALVHVRK